jgi:hypothetical protein
MHTVFGSALFCLLTHGHVEVVPVTSLTGSSGISLCARGRGGPPVSARGFHHPVAASLGPLLAEACFHNVASGVAGAVVIFAVNHFIAIVVFSVITDFNGTFFSSTQSCNADVASGASGAIITGLSVCDGFVSTFSRCSITGAHFTWVVRDTH